jgi:hypothetical protein
MATGVFAAETYWQLYNLTAYFGCLMQVNYPVEMNCSIKQTIAVSSTSIALQLPGPAGLPVFLYMLNIQISQIQLFYTIRQFGYFKQGQKKPTCRPCYQLCKISTNCS